MNQCIFIDMKTNTLSKCNFKSCYGGYCKKHKREYLIDSDNTINIQRFTFKSSDYLKEDLLRFYSRYHDGLVKQNRKEKKEFYFSLICDIITRYNLYHKQYIETIIKLQSYIRRFIVNHRFIYRKCNNKEDFYTFDLIHEIKKEYLYVYCDKRNIYWGFDIRSLYKLITDGFTNPYTLEEFPERLVQDVTQKINNLQELGHEIDYKETIERNRSESIKQKVVDLSSQIELLGYSCNINWFLQLSLRKLQTLYREIEDIWNYRAQLSHSTKISIAPPDGNIFSYSINEIMTYTNIQDLQDLLLQELIKISNSTNIENKRLGYMYFLVGLSRVSRECYMTHISWISYI